MELAGRKDGKKKFTNYKKKQRKENVVQENIGPLQVVNAQ